MIQNTSGQRPPSTDERREITAIAHRRLAWRLILAIAISISFTLALVPLYNVLCRATGLNGRSYGDSSFQVGGFNTGADTPGRGIDSSRLVKIEFTTTVMPGLPWEMHPLTSSLMTHPGDLQLVKYRVRNLSNRTVSGQAIPGVTPGQAARYFHKIECFCFSHQSLGPHEEREMVVAFIIRPNLDAEVSELTLAYAVFPLPTNRLIAISAPLPVRSENRS
ncbi:MAG: cytochrome c oxidase assembly protein [Georgfuchsia sp.]